MAEHRTQALVLRSTDHAESDRVVRLYTEKLGRISALAKGARRSRRRFPGALELLSVSEVRLTTSPRSSLLWLHSARQVRSYERLVSDLDRFALACQLAEMLDRFTAESDGNPRLYRFALGALGVLEEEPADALLGLLLLAKTLAWLGYEPRLQRCAGCGRELAEAALVSFDPRQGGALCSICQPPDPEFAVEPSLLRALARGIRIPLRERHGLGLEPREVRWAQRRLEQFCQFHLGAELRSARFLRELERFDPRVEPAPGPAPDGPGAFPDRGPRPARAALSPGVPRDTASAGAAAVPLARRAPEAEP